MVNTVLVTGGAGYIGSHVVKLLGERKERIVVLDNLSTGFAESVLYGELVVGDVGDQALVERILREYEVDSVMHFAAATIVPESIADPVKYYTNNVCASNALLGCCRQAGIKQFVFSSTAAVYGQPAGGIATEDTPENPINPYGRSKLISEWMIGDLCSATDMRSMILRYFNVAGSDPEGRIGQSTIDATLLIKIACEVALGKVDRLQIFGTDYPTPDGTAIRDYIHVNDLATIHLLALDYLREGGASSTLNCGYGHGYSVRQVIAAVERVHGSRLNVVESSRRAGDPPNLIANTDAIRKQLHWHPQLDDLDTIVSTALAWEEKLLAGME